MYNFSGFSRKKFVKFVAVHQIRASVCLVCCLPDCFMAALHSDPLSGFRCLSVYFLYRVEEQHVSPEKKPFVFD